MVDDWGFAGVVCQFNRTTATLSGVPAQYGVWPVTFTATDATASSNTTTQRFTLSVRPLLGTDRGFLVA